MNYTNKSGKAYLDTSTTMLLKLVE